ncbi:MAG: hypothetical protein HC786_05270 [Richelia sp. CSU_2_1]|nr:hypothetical protein [Microcoleus sp. SU_5_6]NJL69002.1 hypothetical protein [Microcoleus sp. SM1_3_4]NJR21618.1 hypothetical protein [Richelia sp. CSU_2_1]
MNNHLPQPGQDSWQSQLNDFVQSLDLDLVIDAPHSDRHSDTSLPQNHLPDHSQQPNFIHANQLDILPDFSLSGWADNPQHQDFARSHQDWHQTSGLEAHHQPHHQLHNHEEIMAVYSSYTTHRGSDDILKGPHVDIRDNGHIYLHHLNGETVDVGYVRGHAMYNSSGWEVGYFKDSGEVYKYNYSVQDNCIGKVENGHIYNVEHQQIGRADTNLEGAAHLLFAVGGGAKT